MAAVSNTRLFVAPPTFTPLPFGLLSVLGSELRDEADPHWRMGVTWRSLCADSDVTYDPCFAVTGAVTGVGVGQPPPTPEPKSATFEIDHRGATPFTVYAEVDCSAVGFYEGSDEDARRALVQSEQFQVERAFWTGVGAGEVVVLPHLAANGESRDPGGVMLQPAATVVSTSLDVVNGLGALEEALAECFKGVGYVHAPLEAIPPLAEAMNLKQVGGRYETYNGNRVVAGAGYPGTGPVGQTPPAGSTWLFATGPVFAYRSGIKAFGREESLDRSVNTLKMIAERTYVVGFDCCLLAVQVTL